MPTYETWITVLKGYLYSWWGLTWYWESRDGGSGYQRQEEQKRWSFCPSVLRLRKVASHNIPRTCVELVLKSWEQQSKDSLENSGLGWQSNCRLNLSSEKFSSCSQKELGQFKWPDAQMFSHFKLQHRIIIIITSWLIFHQYKMRIKSTGFQVKLTWVWILASPSSC